MKKFLAITFIATTLFSCGPTRDEAIDYNDKIIGLQKSIDNKEVALLESFKTHKAADIDKAYSDFKTEIETNTAELEKLGPLSKNSTLIDAAKGLFVRYKEVAETDYKQLVEINKLSDEDYTDASLEEENKCTADINKKLDAGLADFTATQEKFASEYGFQIEKTAAEAK